MQKARGTPRAFSGNRASDQASARLPLCRRRPPTRGTGMGTSKIDGPRRRPIDIIPSCERTQHGCADRHPGRNACRRTRYRACGLAGKSA